MIKGGLWKISNENDIEHAGGNHFFPEKEKEMKICYWTRAGSYNSCLLFHFDKMLIQN